MPGLATVRIDQASRKLEDRLRIEDGLPLDDVDHCFVRPHHPSQIRSLYRSPAIKVAGLFCAGRKAGFQNLLSSQSEVLNQTRTRRLWRVRLRCWDAIGFLNEWRNAALYWGCTDDL